MTNETPSEKRRRLTTYARLLRREQTDAEALLWSALRRGAIAGARFRRQQPVGPYVADFYCREHRLVIEVDGGGHFEQGQQAIDAERTRYLQEVRGLRVLRFTNLEVLRELESVVSRASSRC